VEFDKAGAQIVVVSFGSRNAALQWRQETGCKFPILLDANRQVRLTVSSIGIISPRLVGNTINLCKIVLCEETCYFSSFNFSINMVAVVTAEVYEFHL